MGAALVAAQHTRAMQRQRCRAMLPVVALQSAKLLARRGYQALSLGLAGFSQWQQQYASSSSIPSSAWGLTPVDFGCTLRHIAYQQTCHLAAPAHFHCCVCLRGQLGHTSARALASVLAAGCWFVHDPFLYARGGFCRLSPALRITMKAAV